ncbi:MAG: mechanosensitive ion channel [Blastocatellia bacterium]|nr:mechanosensitive ion channel [Blastocatellia bacterium]
MSAAVQETIRPATDILNYSLFTLGNATITPLTLIYIAILGVLLVYFATKLRNLLIGRLLQRTKLDQGAQQAIGTISRYVVIFVGFLVILQTVGIDLTTLNVLAGAVGIGIGFGLQNIANNFISGLIIMLERPIKVGDRIEVGEVHGRVLAIGARSTSVRTNDNIAIIVPNSKFISENVINWSFETDIVRFRIPISVSYNSDVDLVSKLLVEAAIASDDVVSDPAPSVRFLKFEDSSLFFELRAWSRVRLHKPGLFQSNLNFAILRKFREHNIEIPYPQRDLHIRSGNLTAERVESADAN